MHGSQRRFLISTSAFAFILAAVPMAPDAHSGWLKSTAVLAASASATSKSHAMAGGGSTSSRSHSEATAGGAGALASAGGSASAHNEGANGNSADSAATSQAGATGNDAATDTSTADGATSGSFGSDGVVDATMDLVTAGAGASASGSAGATSVKDDGTIESVSLDRSSTGDGEVHVHSP